MKLRFVTAALAALLLASMAHAQTQPASGAGSTEATGKVGVISFRQAIANTAEGKQAQAELQSQFAPRQTELENLRKQIEDGQKRLNDGARTMSDEEKVRVSRQIDQWTRLGQRKQQELQDDVDIAQDEVLQRIGGKMLDVIDRYARENGFSLVVDVSAQSSTVLFFTPGINITQDIIRLYDQAYPLKGGAQPAPQQPRPQPGQPKPQQPAPKPPQQ